MKYVTIYVILNIISLFLHLSYSDKISCEESEVQLVDPRETYDVDLSTFNFNSSIEEEKVYNEVIQGIGYDILKGLFDPLEIKHARETILYLISKQGSKATHFQGGEGAKPELQARVWNLLNKGKIFEKVVQHPTILNIGKKIIGDDMQLGSIASNTIFPGGSGQEPHIDYPYWDYYDKDHWPQPPKHKDIPFYMNLQILIPLDDLTPENGATSVRPYTQVVAEYPTNVEEYRKNEERVLAKAGDAVIFVGTLQHCAMPNHSKYSRSVLLIQYLPKFIRPMEDQKRMLKKNVHDRASQNLRKLLLLDYPYPAILDDEESGNSEGSKSDFKWKK